MNDTAVHEQYALGDEKLIGQLAQQIGLEPKTVRYYERAGLLKPRRIGRLRVFALDDVERLRVIKLLRDFDLPIRTIKSILDQNASMRVDDLPVVARNAITQQLEIRKAEIRRLEDIRLKLNKKSGCIHKGDPCVVF